MYVVRRGYRTKTVSQLPSFVYVCGTSWLQDEDSVPVAIICVCMCYVVVTGRRQCPSCHHLCMYVVRRGYRTKTVSQLPSFVYVCGTSWLQDEDSVPVAIICVCMWYVVVTGRRQCSSCHHLCMYVVRRGYRTKTVFQLPSFVYVCGTSWLQDEDSVPVAIICVCMWYVVVTGRRQCPSCHHLYMYVVRCGYRMKTVSHVDVTVMMLIML